METVLKVRDKRNKSRIEKIALEGYGSYLGRDEGCFIIRDNKGNVQRYSHYQKEIGEAILKEGNYVSVDALRDLLLWNIDTYIMTQKNVVVGILKNLEDDSHVKSRISQYEALNNGKGIYIAKQLVLNKIEGQRRVLEKYRLKRYDYPIKLPEGGDLTEIRRRLTGIEGKYARHYYEQIFTLFPEKLRPEGRRTYRAYDGINNVFNFGYYVLKCKIYKALIKAKLEPYLGYLHSIQHGKPSLICDFQELYRYLIDDFLIQRCVKLHKKDFVEVVDFVDHLKIGKKIHLRSFETRELGEALDKFFERMIEVPRIKVGDRQSLETLIREEALLFAKYLRGERDSWTPRLASV